MLEIGSTVSLRLANIDAGGTTWTRYLRRDPRVIRMDSCFSR